MLMIFTCTAFIRSRVDNSLNTFSSSSAGSSLLISPLLLFSCSLLLPQQPPIRQSCQSSKYERDNVQIRREIQTAAFELKTFSFQQQLPVPEKESHVSFLQLLEERQSLLKRQQTEKIILTTRQLRLYNQKHSNRGNPQLMFFFKKCESASSCWQVSSALRGNPSSTTVTYCIWGIVVVFRDFVLH